MSVTVARRRRGGSFEVLPGGDGPVPAQDGDAPQEGASLELRDIRKHFGSTKANDGVNLSLRGGTIHGLLGENGAGKSTLMKVLSGYISADEGAMSLGGERLRLSSPADAVRAGIGMLHQDPLVFLPFSVADNLLLGSGGRPDRTTAVRQLDGVRERFGFSLDPDAAARNLTVGERQQLEITRLLQLQVRVLILDEPTTGISADQRTTLFDALRTLAADGMTVIFVSHKLEEIEEICSDVAVMRHGRIVGTEAMPCPTDRLVELMFGKVFAAPEMSPRELGQVVLDLQRVTLTERGLATRDLSLSVRAGEVVGLAGLEGSGQRTLLRAAAGLLRPDAGSVTVAERELTREPYRTYRDAGVYYMPAGRLEEGLLAGFSITEHVLLARGGGRFVTDWHEARRDAEERIRDYSILGSPETTADALSGGNQQRLLLSLMPAHVRLLLMEHPTRGLDIESAHWIWGQLLERRAQGTAIVFSSADLDELLLYTDRILVFFSGRVLAALDTRSTTGAELGRLIGGVEEGA